MALFVPNPKMTTTTIRYAMVVWWHVDLADDHNKFDWIGMLSLLIAKGTLLQQQLMMAGWLCLSLSQRLQTQLVAMPWWHGGMRILLVVTTNSTHLE